MKKVAKYEKLGKYFPYYTCDLAIKATNQRKQGFCTFCTFYFTLLIYILWTDENTIIWQVFVLVIQEEIMSSNCGSSSNDVKVFNIQSAENPFYWNFYIFYDNIGQKGSFPDIWTFIQVHKDVLFLLLGLFILFVWTRFTKIGGQFMYSIANSGRLYGQGHQINWHFQPLYWQDVWSSINESINKYEKQLFDMTKGFLFVLIPRFCPWQIMMLYGGFVFLSWHMHV